MKNDSKKYRLNQLLGECQSILLERMSTPEIIRRFAEIRRLGHEPKCAVAVTAVRQHSNSRRLRIAS